MAMFGHTALLVFVTSLMSVIAAVAIDSLSVIAVVFVRQQQKL